MDPSHDGITVSRPAQSQSLAPYSPLLLLELVQLFSLGLCSALGKLPLSGNPSLFSAFVDKLGTELLEDGDCEKSEFVILGQFSGAARDDHLGQGFVGLEVVLYEVVGNGEEVLLQVFRGIGSEKFTRVDYGCQGALREVSSAGALLGC